ncbi:ClpXP adapter SpxH family protein [Ectobacillus funiculus]|uniref:ClpXP adapter SpxH family protein n=1 Tax=Ectobacillus funiculus TaxID=137993 RepID=UPI00101CEED3|nr:ClpXP adapter SpxH family protein [Ectobacillus funiculus]
MNKMKFDAANPATSHKCGKKPVEAFLFIDPLCMDCWSIEPLIMKLWLEYGNYFTIRHILTGKEEAAAISPAHKWNKPAHIRFVWENTSSLHGLSCDGKLNKRHSSSSPYMTSIAIKAAELQGRRAGMKFLRTLQESVFLQREAHPNKELLLVCAEKSGIDMEEFKHDLCSMSATKAFQCDLKFTNEMYVTEIPSLIFFHSNSEQEGLKLSGMYPYDVYVQVLQELVHEDLIPEPLPSLEKFLQQYAFTFADEMAVIYNRSLSEAMREMRQLLLTGKAIQTISEKEVYWRYNVKEKDPA